MVEAICLLIFLYLYIACVGSALSSGKHCLQCKRKIEKGIRQGSEYCTSCLNTRALKGGRPSSSSR